MLVRLVEGGFMNGIFYVRSFRIVFAFFLFYTCESNAGFSPNSSGDQCFVDSEGACSAIAPADGYFFSHVNPGSNSCQFDTFRRVSWDPNRPIGTYTVATYGCDHMCEVGYKEINGFCEKPEWIKKNPGPPVDGACAGNPIHVGFANKYQKAIDYRSTFSAERNLNLIRHYNSRLWPFPEAGSSIFGANWRTVFQQQIAEISENKYALFRADGKVLDFTYDESLSRWRSDDDVYGLLELLAGGFRYTNYDGNDEVEIYDDLGRLVNITYDGGYSQSLDYSKINNGFYLLDSNGDATSEPLPEGLLIKVTDSLNRQLIFGYDNKLHVAKVIDPSGGVYIYNYDYIGNLTSVKYPDGKILTYIYGERNHTQIYQPHALTGIVSEDGNRFATWMYDARGGAYFSAHNEFERVTANYSNLYDPITPRTELTNSLNKQATLYFQAIQNVIKVIRVEGYESTHCAAASHYKTYYSNGELQTRTDWNGNVTYFERDSQGRVTLEVTGYQWLDGQSRFGEWVDANPVINYLVKSSNISSLISTKTCWSSVHNKMERLIEADRVTIYEYFADGKLKSKKIEPRSVANEECI